MNQWNGIGRLARDAVLIETKNNKQVTKFAIFVDRPFTGTEKKADIIPIEIWGSQALLAANSLKKGHRVGITGRITTNVYDKDGEKKRVFCVTAEHFDFLEKKNKDTDQTTEKEAPIPDDDMERPL